MSPRIYNKRTDKDMPPDAVYVGRPSKWGNPFTVADAYKLVPGCSKEDAHKWAVAAFRSWMHSYPHLIDLARKELRGKSLVCWCAPLACHAQVLMELANEVQQICQLYKDGGKI